MSRGSTCFILLTAILFLSGCAQFQSAGRLNVDTLHDAIVTDDVSYIRAAVESGAISPNQRIPAPVYMEGTPLLTIAARAASLDVMRYLISAGADINAKTPAIETPLMLAAYFSDAYREQGDQSNYRHAKAVRMLVEAGADTENDANNYTALAYAAYQGHDHILRYLIKHGAHLNADASDGMIYVNTPLMMAAIQGHSSTALDLLNAGADARIRVHGGHTAAEFAENYRHTQMISMLRCAESLGEQETFRNKCGAGNIAGR